MYDYPYTYFTLVKEMFSLVLLRYHYEKYACCRYKRLPMQDGQIHERFKQLFGYKRAIKYKVTHNIQTLLVVNYDFFQYNN